MVRNKLNKKILPKGCVLIVDDEHATHISNLVERLGYFAIPYSSGLEILNELKETDGLEYDLALVDLSLFGMDGNEVIGALKDKYPTRPVIVISSYGEVKPSRADGIFTKPFVSDQKKKLFENLLASYIIKNLNYT